MASFLDIGLLEYFLPAFTFLFIFVVSYAVLDKFKLIGDNKGLKLLAAFSIAILFLFSTDALQFVNFITPWFIVMVIIAMFLIALFMFMGVKEDAMVKAVGSGEVVWTVILIAIILLIIALVHVFGSFMSPYEEGSTEQVEKTITSDGTESQTRESESLKTIVNPKILGALFLLIIATFAITYISKGLTAT
ncbi:MAG: hypothetical protein ISS82_03190 [Nanoarchaeota archaeon]|nr:hypothetical protein [Nanoarchaeota archaeon]